MKNVAERKDNEHLISFIYQYVANNGFVTTLLHPFNVLNWRVIQK